MDISIYTTGGSAKGKVAVSDRIFNAKVNKDLIYQVATSQMSNMRQVLAHTKTRAEVSGGGKKPWAQKGTGNARHGSIRSPIWVGGGVAHGPTKDVNFKRKVNKSQGRAALMAVLSSAVIDKHLMIADSLLVDSGKTKDAVALLKGLTSGFEKYRNQARVLVVLAGTKEELATRRAYANLAWVQTIRAQDLNALTVLSFPYTIIAKDALAVVEKTLGKKEAKIVATPVVAEAPAKVAKVAVAKKAPAKKAVKKIVK